MTSAAERNARKDWTLLVYLAGDNNLSDEMVWNLQEMAKAASVPAVYDSLDLVAMFDPKDGKPRRFDLVKGARHAESSADGELSKAAMCAGEGREVAVSSLVDRFVVGQIERLPETRRYAVILSGHGSGAVGDFLTDREPASTLSIPTLGKILERAARSLESRTGKRGAKLGLLGMDSCRMSTIEVAYEVRDSVRYLVASEGSVLNAGWPYHRVLEAFADGTSAKSVGETLAERYARFYRDYELAGISTDISVVDLTKLGDERSGTGRWVGELASRLADVLRELVPDGMEEGVELGHFRRAGENADFARRLRDAVVLAHWSAQSYKGDRYVDLADFCEQLLRYSSAVSFSTGDEARLEPIEEACERIAAGIDGAVTMSKTTGPKLQHSRGLSVYFPWSREDYAREYGNLAFARATGWADFLETYVTVTSRMRRYQETRFEKDERASERPYGVIVPVAEPGWGGVLPEEPLARTNGVPNPGSFKDFDAGTHKDFDAGTHKGKRVPSSMRNPPDGFYEPSSK